MKVVVRFMSHLHELDKDVHCVCRSCELGQPFALGYLRYKALGSGIQLRDLLGNLMGTVAPKDEMWLMPRLRRGEFWMAKFRSRCVILDPIPTALVWRDHGAERQSSVADAEDSVAATRQGLPVALRRAPVH